MSRYTQRIHVCMLINTCTWICTVYMLINTCDLIECLHVNIDSKYMTTCAFIVTIILCTFFFWQKPALFEDSDFDEENNDFYIRPQFHGKKGRKVKDNPLGSCGRLFFSVSLHILSDYMLI